MSVEFFFSTIPTGLQIKGLKGWTRKGPSILPNLTSFMTLSHNFSRAVARLQGWQFSLGSLYFREKPFWKPVTTSCTNALLGWPWSSWSNLLGLIEVTSLNRCVMSWGDGACYWSVGIWCSSPAFKLWVTKTKTFTALLQKSADRSVAPGWIEVKTGSCICSRRLPSLVWWKSTGKVAFFHTSEAVGP